MLEENGILLTWRIDVPPERICQNCTAEKIFDHPLGFLTYEGKVNNGKASVSIADKGFYSVMYRDENEMEIHFKGRILEGAFRLSHKTGDTWNLCPEP